jgi:hypothetical protein
MAVVAACSQASSPAKNPGDDIYVDVEASTMLPQPDAADYDDGFFNGTDGAYGATSGDIVLTICPPPDGSVSDGSAGAGADSAAPKASASDASAVAYSDAGWSSGAYGTTGSAGPCQAMPAACASQPTCDCFLTALKSTLPCTYPHCDDAMGAGFPIYCP